MKEIVETGEKLEDTETGVPSAHHKKDIHAA